MLFLSRFPSLAANALSSLARHWSVLVLLSATVSLLATLVIGALAWYYSYRIESGALSPDHSLPKLDLRVQSVGDGRIALAPTSDAERDGNWTQDGLWGLEWPGGYAHVGQILEIDSQHVVREFAPIWGQPKLENKVRLDSFAYPHDPQEALGIAYQNVSIRSPRGDFPAWLFSGPSENWVIAVHGKGSDRAEVLRLLPTLTKLGHPVLSITYSNDEGVPASKDGRFGYGKTEWQEVEAAASYAKEQGAKRVVLVGYSMGGAIVLAFLERSHLAPLVSGIILDAPVLDLSETIDFRAQRKGIPAPITKLAKFAADKRFDIDWDSIDYLSRARDLNVPVLLFHGDADTTVPVSTSDALAEARPDIVTYTRVAGANHVRSWNLDPTEYETAVREFLGRLGK